MGGFQDHDTFTTMDALLKDLSMPPSNGHQKQFAKEEEEILQHYKDWAYYCKYEMTSNPDKGAGFYDLPETLCTDLMGNVPRGGFPKHWELIGPYFSAARIEFKDLEIVATSSDFGYTTMIQHYWGKTSDGNDFDFTFRCTALLRKKGKWRWIHEHMSFPVDIATKLGDFTGIGNSETAQETAKVAAVKAT